MTSQTSITFFLFRFSDMSSFTPPVDSWIIRYPKEEGRKSSKPVPEANQLDDPCQKYIDGSDVFVKSTKSLGTDDHFKSAVCSKNLLKVCEKLMMNKELTRSRSRTDSETVEDDFGELSLIHEKNRMDYYRKKHGHRRGSRSLPSSPKLERKAILQEQPIVSQSPSTLNISQPVQKADSISFLTTIFGITAAKPAVANANLAEKYEYDKNAAIGPSDQNVAAAQRKATTKPQQWREMNMFSPTSM